MAGKTNGSFRLSVQLEEIQGRNQTRIVKTLVLDSFDSEGDAVKEYQALVDDLLEDDGDEADE